MERLTRSLVGAGFALRPCRREATRDGLTTVHKPSYVDRVLGLRGVDACGWYRARASGRAARSDEGCACAGDPQGNMLLETGDFQFVGAATAAAAAGSARGRIGIVLEGGYDVEAIGPCAVAALRALGRTLDDCSPHRLPTAQERLSIEAAARIHGLDFVQLARNGKMPAQPC